MTEVAEQPDGDKPTNVALGVDSGNPDGPPSEQNAAGESSEQREDDSDSALDLRARRAATLDGVREVRRFDATDLELRETSDGMFRFSGYASVTERGYDIADFTETIARGAFKRTLSEQPDVVLLVNHGEGGGLPLARTKSGTMTLSEDARGLRVDADLNPHDPDVKALVPKMRRGDVDEMSFAFRVTDQEWSEDYSQRLIRSVALHKGDVSIVTYAANDAATGTLTTLRSADGALELRAGKTYSADNLARLQGALDDFAAGDDRIDSGLEKLSAAIGVANPDSDDDDDAADADTDTDTDTDAKGSRSVEGEPQAEHPRVVHIPDHTTRAKQRLAALRGER